MESLREISALIINWTLRFFSISLFILSPYMHHTLVGNSSFSLSTCCRLRGLHSRQKKRATFGVNIRVISSQRLVVRRHKRFEGRPEIDDNRTHLRFSTVQIQLDHAARAYFLSLKLSCFFCCLRVNFLASKGVSFLR